MFILEVRYSLLLLHFCSTEHISTCFHFAFYKADFIKQILDSVEIPSHSSPLWSTRVFFSPFPGSDLVRPTSQADRCMFFQGDGEEPKPHLSYHSICTVATAQQQNSRADSNSAATEATATGVRLLPTPQPASGRRASSTWLFGSGGRQEHGEETDPSKIFVLPALIQSLNSITNICLAGR